MEKEYKYNLEKYINTTKNLEITDVFKYIFQSCYGCEHLIKDPSYAYNRLVEEINEEKNDVSDTIEMLDGKYARVHLSIIKQGLSIKTLCNLFIASSCKEEGREMLIDMLNEFILLAKENRIPFNKDDIEKEIEKWEKVDYSPIHHSTKYNQFASPAYRVIKKEYLKYLPLLIAIDKLSVDKNHLIAIEGRCASGKTTLSLLLENLYDCNILHMDDYFLPKDKRSKERLSIPGENIDHERFKEEIIVPFLSNKPIEYRRFCCSENKMLEKTILNQKRLTFVEGVYSLNDDLKDFYDLKVFLDIDSKLQKQRINKRNTPEVASVFFDKWIPLEEAYFNNCKVKEACNIVISINE